MGDGSDKIQGVKGLGPKKLPKMFPELMGDQRINLDDIFEICEAKYKDHDIYARIILEFDRIKDNYKVMDLGNPMLDEAEKTYILEYMKEAPFKLDIPSFVKMYHEDGLGNILKDIEFWLRNNWAVLDRYNKAKK